MRTLGGYELEAYPDAMSTRVVGAEDTVFAAVKVAFRNTTLRGDLVMAVTLSNACPRAQIGAAPTERHGERLDPGKPAWDTGATGIVCHVLFAER